MGFHVPSEVASELWRKAPFQRLDNNGVEGDGAGEYPQLCTVSEMLMLPIYRSVSKAHLESFIF